MRNLMLAFLLLPALAAAQSNATDAAIEGYVYDPSGARIENARVAVTGVRTNQRLETETDELGYYRFALLRIGDYVLEVTAPAMAEYRREGITLHVGQQARIDVVLPVAATAEAITVHADVPMLDTSSGGTGEVLDSQALRSLPIPSRNVYNLHLIGPGVKGMPPSNFATTLYYTGGLNRTTWNVDGMDATSRRFGRQIRLGLITPEAVQEMQLLSGGHSAEFGRSAGSVISIVTRSGTNDFHGSAMFLYRPVDLTARPPLAADVTDQSWWLAGGNLSGPIVRDRLWFFVNDEYNPYREPQPVTITSANAQALGLTAEDLADSDYGETYHSPSVKVNFQAGTRHSGFVRYTRFSNEQPIGRAGLTIGSRTTDYQDRQNTGAAQWTAVVSPTLLSETRFGMSRRIEARSPVGESGPDGAFINIQGVANIGVNPLSGSEGIETTAQISENLTWTKGQHTIKGGFEYLNTNLEVTNALNRTFTFNGLAAAGGRGAVSPLLQYLRTTAGELDPATGNPYTYTQLTQQVGNPHMARRFHFANWFAQDEFRVAPTLTLNFGVRHEMIFFPLLDEQAPHPLSRELADATGNFAPRFGFSFQPTSDGRTVIRGSYGLFYDTPA